jgi:hypothetical protein
MLLPHALRAVNKVTPPVYVGGVTQGFLGSTLLAGYTVSLTSLTGGIASQPAEGDVIVVVFSTGSINNRRIRMLTSGYLLVGTKSYVNDTYDNNLLVAVKVAGASETSVNTTASGSGNDSAAIAVQVWRDVDKDIIVEELAQASGTDTALINPPSITPITQKAVVLAGGGSGHITSLTYNTPSELSNFIQTNGLDDTYDTTVAVGSVSWNSGAVDVGAFSLSSGTDSTSYSYNSFAFALKPGPTQSSNYPTIVDATSAAGTNSTATVTKPTGTASGDLIVIIVVVAQNSPLVFTGPSGFSTADTYDGTALVKYVYTKVAGGSEPADYSVSWTKSGSPVSQAFSIACITLRDATTTGAVYGTNTEATTADPSASGLTLSSRGVLMAVYASSAASTAIAQFYSPSMCTLTESIETPSAIFLYTRKQMAVNTTALSLSTLTNTTYVSQQLFFPRS